MTTESARGLRAVVRATGLGLLFLGLGLPRALASGLEEAPPSPIQVGEQKPAVKIALPEQPVAAPMPQPKVEKAEAAEQKPPAPKKVWKMLSPKHVVSDRSLFYLSVADLQKARRSYGHSALAKHTPWAFWYGTSKNSN